MSRKTKQRRQARRARASARQPLAGPCGKWGDPSGTLTPEERERALSRFRALRGQGGVRFGFVALREYAFDARTPEELDAAVGRRLLEETRGQQPN